MPTYEYRCPDGHDFDHFYRSISASKEELPCPVCGKVATRRVSGGAGLVFKGSGFYITDYGKDGKKDLRTAGKGDAGGAAAGTGSGSSGDAEPKAAGKPEGPTEKPSTPAPPAKGGGES